MVEATGEWREWADSRIKKHDKDLYEGNGRPSITSRMQMVEGDVGRISSSLGKGVWLVVVTLITLVANIAVTILTWFLSHH